MKVYALRVYLNELIRFIYFSGSMFIRFIRCQGKYLSGLFVPGRPSVARRSLYQHNIIGISIGFWKVAKSGRKRADPKTKTIRISKCRDSSKTVQ